MKLSYIKYLISVPILLTLNSCFFFAASQKRNLYIQAVPESEPITNVIRTLVPQIHDIITKELGLPSDYDFSFFTPKTLHKLTLYYVFDINKDNIPLLYSKLKNMNLMKNRPKHVLATSQAEFFGPRENELVILIDDPKKELSELNKKLKSMAHELNNHYKKQHGTPLYDIKQSEKFHYLPHLGIGSIRLTAIKNNIVKKGIHEEI